MLIVVALSLFSLEAKGQQVAVKTNALYWLTTTPNLGVEVALGDKSTLSLNANYNPWTIGSDNQIKHWLVQPEYRYWLCGKFTRSFFGAHLLYGRYNVGGFKLPFNVFPAFATHHYKGWAVGVGVSYGYQWYLGPHWNLEAMIGVGYVRTEYRRTDSRTYVQRNYFGPTEVGISFVYLFRSKK